MRLLIVGPPGAGKGTQGSRLSAVLGVPHISSGEALRQSMAAGTPVGMRASHHVRRGELVPDEIVLQLLRERFRAPEVVERGYLLDGFPRHTAQLHGLRAIDPHGGLDALVELVVTKAVIRERLRRRGRTDDHPSALRTRLAEYQRATVPMLEEVARSTPVVVVDAVQPMDVVTEQILTGLDHAGLDRTAHAPRTLVRPRAPDRPVRTIASGPGGPT